MLLHLNPPLDINLVWINWDTMLFQMHMPGHVTYKDVFLEMIRPLISPRNDDQAVEDLKLNMIVMTSNGQQQPSEHPFLILRSYAFEVELGN